MIRQRIASEYQTNTQVADVKVPNTYGRYPHSYLGTMVVPLNLDGTIYNCNVLKLGEEINKEIVTTGNLISWEGLWGGFPDVATPPFDGLNIYCRFDYIDPETGILTPTVYNIFQPFQITQANGTFAQSTLQGEDFISEFRFKLKNIDDLKNFHLFMYWGDNLTPQDAVVTPPPPLDNGPLFYIKFTQEV